jgi:DNA-binding transcriptional MerR regulator
MHIGELAERAELSLRTIRHYDEIGLLKPSARTEGGFRLYTERDLGRLLLIRRMKPLGYSLEQMAELLAIADRLEADPGDAEARGRLADLLADAEARREKARAQLAMADEFIELLRRR